MLDVLMAAFALTTPDLESPEVTMTSQDSIYLEAAPLPNLIVEESFPEVSAENIFIFDSTSGTPIYAKNADDPKPIASLTKLMTAILAIEKVDENALIVVPAETRGESVRITKVFGLLVNDQFVMRDMLGGMLIASAGDAAVTLAHAAKGDEESFVTEMNLKARSFGLQRTSFSDVFGLSVGNISTAREITWLFAHALKKPLIRKYMGETEITFCSQSGNCLHAFNTNRILGSKVYNVLGGKTGTTDVAGECLVFAVETNRGSTVFISMLDSEDRWGDAEKILKWIFDSYAI